MSWLYSRALVGEYSGENSSDGEQCAPSKLNPTAVEYFVIDRTMEPSTRSQFGTMSKPLTADLGEELLTSFRAGFPAKTSPPPGKGKVLRGQDRGFGQRWLALSGSAAPGSRSSKTPRSFAVADLMSFCKISWRWGTMRRGECLELAMSEPLINETASGFWRTPLASDGTGGGGIRNRESMERLVAKGGRITLRDQVHHDWLWPTGRANDAEKFPTPRATDARPTTRATASTAKRVETGKALLNEHVVNQAGRGTLNPNWVEWLMGWPIGHTDLKPLETGKSQQWLQQHGRY